ncbi:MAG: response regulator [Lachnospiraceae bacterium]|nr:response regulator [Lachnospiraceae bacterium]
MSSRRIMVCGTKESFLIRVLEKKLTEAGFEAEFAAADINVVHSHWQKGMLLTCFLENGEELPQEFLRFLRDFLMDEDAQMILIGDSNECRSVTDNVPGELILKVFPRPLDNESYIKMVEGYFSGQDDGTAKKSILLVDDDANYLNLVRGWLKGRYKVSPVSSGLQAIKWLGKNKADLILLDHEMPVTSGPQVLEMLRSDPETATIPVIFLTGKGDKESVMEVVALKPEGYLLKNIEREELLYKLSEFFMKKKG